MMAYVIAYADISSIGT